MAYDLASMAIIVAVMFFAKGNQDLAPVFITLFFIFAKLCEICRDIRKQQKGGVNINMSQGYSPHKGILSNPPKTERPPDPPPLKKADQAKLLLMEIAQDKGISTAERIEACRILMGK